VFLSSCGARLQRGFGLESVSVETWFFIMSGCNPFVAPVDWWLTMLVRRIYCPHARPVFTG
jgi:hypothetical protein